MRSVVISSGHGKYIRGASGITEETPWGLDEVDEARRVVDQVAEYLRRLGCKVVAYHDDVSSSQDENLNRIVDFHNDQVRDLDCSIHFNAYTHTSEPRGCEVLYVTEDILAEDLSEALAQAGGFIDRGPKFREDLFFLNQTSQPAVLVETCFVDSQADADLYRINFDEICRSIAEVLGGPPPEVDADIEEETEIANGIDISIETEVEVLCTFSGKCSWFGGPDDTGVAPDEGLAFIYEIDAAPGLFLPEQPPGTTGLARRLNPEAFYVACRWDYDVTSKEMLADQYYVAVVRSKRTGAVTTAHPADWGPHENTDRVADLSPGLLEALGLTTDDEVEVSYPVRARVVVS